MIPRTNALQNDMKYAESLLKRGIKMNDESVNEMTNVEVIPYKENGEIFTDEEKKKVKSLHKKLKLN
jgi:hypothetical protein